jgi:hypothetical protein
VGGPEEVAGTEGKPAAGRAEGTGGAAFAEKMNAAAPASGQPAVDGARGPVDAATAAIAADIKAGRLTPGAAVEKLLDQVVAKQLGADAPAALREKIRAALQETLQDDPLLAEKLASLEG